MAKEPGYVYILTNPSFREDWVKIGMTQNMEERLKNLDNTSVPLPFVKYATLQTVKYEKAEKHVHHFIETFTNLRIRDKREFFNVKPEKALEIFCEVAELLDDAVVTKYDANGNPIPVYSPCPPKPDNTAPVKQLDKSKTSENRPPKVWMIPASSKFFNHKACFEEQGKIYWSQYFNFKAGDIIYIYLSSPIMRIKYKCEVLESELPYSQDMDVEIKYYKNPADFEKPKSHNRYFVIKLLAETASDNLTLKKMLKNGLKAAPMGSLNLSDKSFDQLRIFIEDNF